MLRRDLAVPGPAKVFLIDTLTFVEEEDQERKFGLFRCHDSIRFKPRGSLRLLS